MLIASSCDGKSWAETHMSSANNINRLYQQNYLLQSRSFFKYQQLTKTGLYLKYPPALRLQSQHNLSPRSVLVILSTKAAIKPQSISNPQVTLLYDILLTTSLIIINSSFRNTALRASTNGKKKKKTKTEMYADFDVVVPLVPTNVLEENIFENEGVREAHRGESSYSKGARRHQIKADKKYVS